MTEAAVLDSDTVSELSRGRPAVVTRARQYLSDHGRLTLSSITVFERLRGYHAALGEGRPYEGQLRQFEMFAATCRVLPFDDRAAEMAARIWAALSARARRQLADVLIAAIASVNEMTLVTRNRRHFTPIAELPFTRLRLSDWAR